MSYNIFTDDAGGVLWTASQLPAYPTYELAWQQPTVQSTGAETFASAPYRQELLTTLSWSGMSLADKTSFEVFFLNVAVGMANGFKYVNPVTFNAGSPVRFASSSLPQINEVAFGRYKVQMQLRYTTNFQQYTPDGPVFTLPGNQFSIGPHADQYPKVLRPSTGYTTAIPQTYELNTAGDPVIYRKGTRTVVKHSLSLVLTLGQFAALRSFFFLWTHGQHKKFTWIDWDGVSHTVRLGANRITVQQESYNRFTAEIPLLEEL